MVIKIVEKRNAAIPAKAESDSKVSKTLILTLPKESLSVKNLNLDEPKVLYRLQYSLVSFLLQVEVG
jgi:hypothetical protein